MKLHNTAFHQTAFLMDTAVITTNLKQYLINFEATVPRIVSPYDA